MVSIPIGRNTITLLEFIKNDYSTPTLMVLDFRQLKEKMRIFTLTL